MGRYRCAPTTVPPLYAGASSAKVVDDAGARLGPADAVASAQAESQALERALQNLRDVQVRLAAGAGHEAARVAAGGATVAALLARTPQGLALTAALHVADVARKKGAYSRVAARLRRGPTHDTSAITLRRPFSPCSNSLRWSGAVARSSG